MNYTLDPYAKSTPTSTPMNDMVASYPGNTSGFLKLQSHAEFYPNYTTILQEFLTVYGNPAAVYVPDVVPPSLIDPRGQQPGFGGATPVPTQQQQQQFQPQVIGAQQQVVTQGQAQQQVQQQVQQQQQQAQQAPDNAMNIGKLLGLGAVAYVLYTLIKKR